jgi:hypothetical protein
VVNVISGDLPAALPGRPEWAAAAQTESAHPGGAASLRGTLPLGRGWAAMLRAGARSSGDMRIGTDPVLGDRLANTAASSRSAALGLGYVGDALAAGGALRAYGFRYGLPVPPGSDPVSLRGHRLEASGRVEASPGSALLPGFRVEGTAQDYTHDELDGAGHVQQTFALRTGSAGALLRQGRLGPFAEGAWGVSGLLKRYDATGPRGAHPARGFARLGRVRRTRRRSCAPAARRSSSAGAGTTTPSARRPRRSSGRGGPRLPRALRLAGR